MDAAASTGSLLKKLFKGSDDDEGLWQDREIRFDNSAPQLALCPGEILFDTVDDVEDTKGNSGEKGVLMVSNLRLMWTSDTHRRTNLSIGYSCIVNMAMKPTKSRLKGKAQAIYILTKYNGSRFEFIFTSLVQNSPALFSAIQSIYRNYDATRLYRELKLRANIIHEKQLRLLPEEELYSKVSGVWNLSSEQGNLGSFFITSVRVVWYANLSPNFNVSIPYVQIKQVRIRESKFGKALVMETSPRSGSYILGFKVDPESKMQETSQEIQSLFQVFSAKPNFGVKYEPMEGAAARAAAAINQIPKFDDDVSIVEGEGGKDVLASYYVDGVKAGDRQPVYSPELGLAIEGLEEGVTVDQLWNVL